MLILFSILFARSKIFKAKNMDGWGENYKLFSFFFHPSVSSFRNLSWAGGIAMFSTIAEYKPFTQSKAVC